ncbi:MAG: hypothetical protein ACKOFW_12275 [Planctomycetaceae bacterium]
MTALRRVGLTACLGLSGWLLTSGCSSRGNLEVLEAELRTQEDTRVELERKVSTLQTELRVAQGDADRLRTQLAGQNRPIPAAEESRALFRAQELKFAPLMTGGWDRDDAPGDEGLCLLLTPVDEHGDLVKLPGETEIEALDLAAPPEDQRLGLWKFDTEEVAQAWHKGVLSAGFLFRIPWQSIPQREKITLVARMKIADGRQFDANLPVTINPPGTLRDPMNDPQVPPPSEPEPLSSADAPAPREPVKVPAVDPPSATKQSVSTGSRNPAAPPPIRKTSRKLAPATGGIAGSTTGTGPSADIHAATTSPAPSPAPTAGSIVPASPVDSERSILESDSYRTTDVPVRR